MLEKLLPYNICAQYTPGAKLGLVDFGSRAPITQDNHREFRIENNDIGIKVKTNRVKSLNFKEHSLMKLA